TASSSRLTTRRVRTIRTYGRSSPAVTSSHVNASVGKRGNEVWIRARYYPVLDASGAVQKIVKVAADITAEKLKEVESAGKLDAISRVQAIIEFDTEGRILSANKNFLSALDYELKDVLG